MQETGECLVLTVNEPSPPVGMGDTKVKIGFLWSLKHLFFSLISQASSTVIKTQSSNNLIFSLQMGLLRHRDIGLFAQGKYHTLVRQPVVLFQSHCSKFPALSHAPY